MSDVRHGGQEGRRFYHADRRPPSAAERLKPVLGQEIRASVIFVTASFCHLNRLAREATSLTEAIKMKKTIKKTIALALTCLAATQVGATPVQVREVDPLVQGLWSNGLQLPIQASAANYWSGLQNIIVDGTSQLLAFCIDPWELSPRSNQPYVERQDFNAYFGSARAGLIRELYADAYSSTLAPSAAGRLSAAAFQLALWEIIGDSQINLASGAVRKVSSTNPAIVSATQTLLDHLGDGRGSGSGSGDNFVFDIFSSGKAMGVGNSGYQDYLVVNRIPEPASAALLLTALSLLGFRQSRRSKQRGAG